MPRKQGNIVRPFSESRCSDGEDAQPKEQILSERAGRHHCGEIPVGGGDNPDVDRNPPAFAAEAFDLPFLQNVQQPGLAQQGKLTDFVEEDRSRVSGFELSSSLPVRAREGAPFVAEEFAFNKVVWDCTAIDHDERSGAAPAEPVNCPGRDAFAGAAFSVDQDCPVAFGRLAEGLSKVCDGRTATNERLHAEGGKKGRALSVHGTQV